LIDKKLKELDGAKLQFKKYKGQEETLSQPHASPDHPPSSVLFFFSLLICLSSSFFLFAHEHSETERESERLREERNKERG
jgi:hypothetical protein